MLDNRDFDGWAGSYDSDVRESAQRYPFAGYEELMGRIAARIIEKRRGGAPVSVLDLGCGTGVLASRLAEAGCSVTGVDFSAEMLAEAARRCPSLRPIRADFSAGLPDGLGRRLRRRRLHLRHTPPEHAAAGAAAARVPRRPAPRRRGDRRRRRL